MRTSCHGAWRSPQAALPRSQPVRSAHLRGQPALNPPVDVAVVVVVKGPMYAKPLCSTGVVLGACSPTNSATVPASPLTCMGVVVQGRIEVADQPPCAPTQKGLMPSVQALGP